MQRFVPSIGNTEKADRANLAVLNISAIFLAQILVASYFWGWFFHLVLDKKNTKSEFLTIGTSALKS